MRQVLAGPAELSLLREENAKWRQRVPKLTESLRLRGEALAHAERLNTELRASLAALQAEVAVLRSGPDQAASARDAIFDRERIEAQRSQLEQEVLSLQKRNQHLQNAVEILNTRLEAAVEDLAALRTAPAAMVADSPVSNTPSETPAQDDARILLRIRGVGNKTLSLLMDAGISSIESLAGLPEDVLDDPEFPLFPWRTRIRKERWVAQAREIMSRAQP